MKDNIKIVLFTQGSYGIDVVKQLFSNRVLPDEIIVITDKNNNSNFPLITFLDYFKIKYLVSSNKLEINTYLEYYNIEIILSIANRLILDRNIISKADTACVNLHPGILPNYRGSFSIPWSIINKEKFVGYTYHLIDQGIDTGEIIYLKKIKLKKSDTAFDLNFKLMLDAISKISFILKNINKLPRIENDKTKGEYYKNEFPFLGLINQSWDHNFIKRYFRACYFPPYPAAFLFENGKKIEFNSHKDYIKYIKNG